MLSDADYQMVSLVVDSERDTERVARYLSGGFVDGVIIVSARQNDAILEVVRNLNLVSAFVGHPRADLPWVGIDNLHAAEASPHSEQTRMGVSLLAVMG